MLDIKAAIFDVDGVILDSMPTWHDSGYRYLTSIGIDADPNLGDRLFSETPISGAEYIIKEYNLDMTPEEVAEGIAKDMEKFYYDEVMPKPGAKRVLKVLKAKGIPMVVATSTPKFCIDAAFERLGLTDYFCKIYSCNDEGTTKQEPKIFHMACDAMGVSAGKDVYLFEDGLYSIKTAKALDLGIVGVYDKISEREQDEIKELADVYITDWKEFEI